MIRVVSPCAVGSGEQNESVQTGELMMRSGICSEVKDWSG